MAISRNAGRPRRPKPIRRPVPYAYRPGRSPLHRLGAGCKLLALFAVSTLSFIFGPPALGGGTLLVLAGSLAAGIRPWELLRGFRPLFVMALMVILYRSVGMESHAELGAIVFLDLQGLTEGLAFGWGIALAFGAASLFFSTTTMAEIKGSLDRLRLKRFSGLSKLSLGISLMLGFLPRFFAVWENTETAYRARCGKKGLPQLLALIPLVMERMLAIAGETAAALESRGCML